MYDRSDLHFRYLLNTKRLWENKIIPSEMPVTEIPRRDTCYDHFVKLFSTAKKHLGDFCEKTSVPGFKYLVETHRPWPERMLWLAALVAALALCLVLVLQTWHSWIVAPIIVTVDQSQQPVWTIPFPAVTICAVTKVPATKFNISDAVLRLVKDGDISQHKLNTYKDLSLICDELPESEESSFKNSSVIDTIERHSFDIPHMIIQKSYGPPHGETPEFQPLLTEEGLCYTFNMLPEHLVFSEDSFHASRGYLEYSHANETEWNPDDGYGRNAGSDAHPLRSLGSSLASGLHLLMRTADEDLDDFCSSAMKGYKVLLHSPIEFPLSSQQSFFLPMNSAVQVAVVPDVTMMDHALAGSYSVRQRQCFFQEERKLRFFKAYTQQNCELECLANFTLLFCGCVEFYMPRVLDTPICGLADRNCSVETGDRMRLAQFGINYDEDGGIPHNCFCFQSCITMKYKSERSVADLDAGKLSKTYASAYNWSLQNDHYSRIWIYFKVSSFVPFRRMELYGTLTWIANCGGLVGLCLGMSVLSAIELLYLLLVRPWCRQNSVSPRTPARKKKKKRKFPLPSLIFA